jgi:outer membrane protein assembly factor BamB
MLKNKIAAITISIFFILAASATLTQHAGAQAQDANPTVTTMAFLSVAPNPVGIGQSVQVEFWVEPIHPLSEDYFTGYVVKITSPSGEVQTMGPYRSQGMQATQFIKYTPGSVGNYTFEFTYGGQFFSDANETYSAATAVPVTLVVQQTPVLGYPESPLPTSYWSNPINAQNQNWASISGNWLFRGGDNGSELGYGDSWGGYNPYTTADTTAHIMWTQQMTAGGLEGGSLTGSYYSGATYAPRLDPPIIIDGLAIYGTQVQGATDNEPANLPGTECVNLKTGAVLWNNPNITVNFGQVWQYTQVPTEDGQGGRALLWGNITNSEWSVYDAFTGQFVFGYYNTEVHDNQRSGWWGDEFLAGNDGTIYDYVLDGATAANTTWLAEWNSTLAYVANGIGTDYATPGYYNWLLGVQYNVTEPSYIVSGVGGPSRQAISDGVLLARVWDGSEHCYYEMGYNINNGQQMWVHPKSESIGTFFCFADGGIYASYDISTASWVGYNIQTGQKIWTTESNTGWGDYVAYGDVIAEGALYAGSWDGYLTAYNATNGKTLWRFFAGNSGTATPYGSFPMWGGVVVGGGVVYSAGGTESPPNPLFQGYRLFAINETTGKGIWSISGYFSVKAIAEGYLMAFNSYDNTAYTFGQGPSKTTVAAPDIGVTTGTPIVITGSITDTASAASNPVVAANFPNGLPCVSDASMTQFMEAVYMQQSMPSNITGVPVTFYVLDSNNNYREIGTTTTNALGDYSFTWTPDIPGKYTVYAAFAGTDGYYGSTASTGFYASAAAPSSAPTATPMSGLASNTTVEYGIVAIAIIIIIIGAVLAILVTRKHP